MEKTKEDEEDREESICQHARIKALALGCAVAEDGGKA
jgi:hypothetical protein